MLKRAIAIILCLTMCLGLVACGKDSSNQPDESTPSSTYQTLPYDIEVDGDGNVKPIETKPQGSDDQDDRENQDDYQLKKEFDPSVNINPVVPEINWSELKDADISAKELMELMNNAYDEHAGNNTIKGTAVLTTQVDGMGIVDFDGATIVNTVHSNIIQSTPYAHGTFEIKCSVSDDVIDVEGMSDAFIEYYADTDKNEFYMQGIGPTVTQSEWQYSTGRWRDTDCMMTILNKNDLGDVKVKMNDTSYIFTYTDSISVDAFMIRVGESTEPVRIVCIVAKDFSSMTVYANDVPVSAQSSEYVKLIAERLETKSLNATMDCVVEYNHIGKVEQEAAKVTKAVLKATGRTDVEHDDNSKPESTLELNPAIFDMVNTNITVDKLLARLKSVMSGNENNNKMSFTFDISANFDYIDDSGKADSVWLSVYSEDEFAQTDLYAHGTGNLSTNLSAASKYEVYSDRQNDTIYYKDTFNNKWTSQNKSWTEEYATTLKIDMESIDKSTLKVKTDGKHYIIKVEAAAAIMSDGNALAYTKPGTVYIVFNKSCGAVGITIRNGDLDWEKGGVLIDKISELGQITDCTSSTVMVSSAKSYFGEVKDADIMPPKSVTGDNSEGFYQDADGAYFVGNCHVHVHDTSNAMTDKDEFELLQRIEQYCETLGMHMLFLVYDSNEMSEQEMLDYDKSVFPIYSTDCITFLLDTRNNKCSYIVSGKAMALSYSKISSEMLNISNDFAQNGQYVDALVNMMKYTFNIIQGNS